MQIPDSPHRAVPFLKPPRLPRPTAHEVRALVDQGYTKAPLAKVFEAYLRPLFATRPASPHHNLKRNASKQALVDAVTTLFLQRDLFLELLEQLPAAGREAIRRIAWYGPHSVGQMTHLLGTDVMVATAAQGYYRHVKSDLDAPFCLLMVDVGGYDRQSPNQLWRASLYLPMPLRVLIQHYLPPPNPLQPAAEEPGTAFRYVLDPDQPARLARCALFLAEGHLEYTKTGKPKRTSVRQMQTYCQIPELFPDKTGPYSFLATERLIARLADVLTPELGGLEGLDLLRDLLLLFTEVDFDRTLADAYLPHLKRRSALFDFEAELTARTLLPALLSVLPPHTWMPVEALLHFVQRYDLPVEPFALHTARHLAQVQHVVRTYPMPAHFNKDSYYVYYHDQYLTADLYPEVVTRPLLQGFLADMAFLGVVDLAYDYPANDVARTSNKPYLSVYDGVRFVRLNALGTYMTGHSATYDVPASDSRATTVTLNPEYLILTLDGDDKIKEMIAEQVGTRLSPGRYRVDYAAFLRDCASRADVEHKVDRFRRHLTTEVPERWEAFFKEVVRKVNPLREQPRVRVFKLDGDAELIRLFARDEVLQRYARKAEGHQVLIEERHVSRVRKRLEQFGYLMTV